MTIARTLYDAAGRKVASIANYVNGTPNDSGTNDDDIYTRWTYSGGLMTEGATIPDGLEVATW